MLAAKGTGAWKTSEDSHSRRGHPLLDEIRRQPSVTVDVVAASTRGWKAGPGVLDAEVMLATHPPGNLRSMKELRWIQLGSAGFEQLFDLPLVEMGITVTNSSGVNDVPIAEWCLGMMFLFERDFRKMLENQKDHVWNRDRKFQAELRGAWWEFWVTAISAARSRANAARSDCGSG